jgi:hypothetical protein
VNASATLNISKGQRLAELEAASNRGNSICNHSKKTKALSPALRSKVANLRIEDSQNLPERKLQ